MVVATLENFLATLEKSRLLAPEQFAELSRSAAGSSQTGDGTEFAKRLIKSGVLTRWQAEQLLGGKSQLILGKYVLLERIGKGGMGSVYKARHRVMNREVALKVMSPALLHDQQAVARFEREVRAAAQLNHPHIVTAYDADCVGNTHFLVMEYVEGHDLTHWLGEHGTPSIPWACECIRQAALGLQHAHERGMVHRDLKPGNLLVTTCGADRRFVVKILDMGLARFTKASSDDGELTRSGQVVGTPDYIAPEQVMSTKGADIRADIYSLGCTLFRLLTGHTPFQGETMLAKLMARLNTPAPRLSTYRQDVPKPLDDLVAKMLELDPALRPQTPVEVATALSPFAQVGDSGLSETIALDRSLDSPTVQAIPRVSAAETPLSTPVTTRPAGDHQLQDFLKHLGEPPANSVEPAASTESTGPGHEHPPTRHRREGIPQSLLIMLGASLVVLVVVAAVFVATRPRSPQGTEISSAVQHEASPSSEIPTAESAALPATEPNLPAVPTASPQLPAVPAIAAEMPVPTAPPADAPQPSESSTTIIPPASPPPTPAPPAPPVVPSPAADSPIPTSPPATAAPKTIVVGVNTGELPDLKTAFEQAVSGDRIVIRHRGPLDLAPLNLTGKTPLTIEGDQKGGEKFWPVIRHAPMASGEAPSTGMGATVGWFAAADLQITLRGLHLVLGGPNRENLTSVFQFGTGQVTLEECSVTVASAGSPAGDPQGPAVDLIRIVPNTPGNVEVLLRKCFLRGTRLHSCLIGDQSDTARVHIEKTLWAGGPAPWLRLRDSKGPTIITLRDSTLYNPSNLLEWEGSANKKATFRMNAENSLFVGSAGRRNTFLEWNSQSLEEPVTDAAGAGAIAWEGTHNVFHRFHGFFGVPRQKTTATLEAWRALWKQTAVEGDKQADPMFTVWPEGHVLEQTLPSDLRPRFQRNRRAEQRSVATDLGAPVDDLPVPIGRALQLPAAVPPEAGTPRPPSRILRIHRQDGPYKTIEAAMEDARDDDILELADNGPYHPQRNFSIRPSPSILFSPTLRVFHLRAAEGTQPQIVIDESAQRGAIPAAGTNGRELVLLQLPKAEEVRIDGIHFRFRTAETTRRGVARWNGITLFRCSNCTFVDQPPGLGIQTNGGGTDCFAHGAKQDLPMTWWLENNFYWCQAADCRAVDILNSRALVHIKNCISHGAFFRKWGSAAQVDAYCNTFFGVALQNMDGVLNIGASTDNLVLVPPGTSMASSVPLPVSAINSSVRFEGPGNPKDPYRGYRVKKGQPGATAGADGGPLGARHEYLPDLPTAP